MTIHYFTPYSLERDLGKAYNDTVKLVTDKEDWICLVDADLMFLTPDFGHQIKEIIDLYPNTGLFSCYVNRVGTKEQCHNGIISEEPNILHHRKIAIQLAKENRHKIKEIQNPFSGHLMLFKKETWDLIGGAPEGRGILSVDNTITNRMAHHGYKMLVMEGVYCFHYYRLAEGRTNKSHLLG